MNAPASAIGDRLKQMRRENGWTLERLSRRSGVSISALSKIENGQVAPSFDTLIKISQGFAVAFEDLLKSQRPAHPVGRYTTTRAGSGVMFSTDMYKYEVHSAGLTQKHMIPLHMEIKARKLSEISKWSSHEGEEFIYVLRGIVELHTEFYAAVTLKAGDSAYIDSQMRHSFIAKGKSKAEILSICLSKGLDFGQERSPKTDGGADAARAVDLEPALRQIG